MKKPVMLAAVLLLALPALAGLSKYKDWPQSPEGLFMTKAERRDWAKLESDADAEKFIADFHARRLDNFQAEVADRAQHADKLLTIGKTEGSKSLRGRIVILFGPPAQIDVAEETVTNSQKRDNPIVASAMSNINTTAEMDKGGGITGSTISTSVAVRIMHFNYQGAIAKVVDKKQIDINVEIDPISGKDRMRSRSEESDLDAMSELIAQAWIKK